jgi:hypothetical protein
LSPVSVEYFPAEQPAHWSLDVNPNSLEYFPAGHGLSVVDDVRVEKELGQ